MQARLNQSRHATRKSFRMILLICMMIASLSISFLPQHAFGVSDGPLVYVVTLDDTVEKGLHAYLSRAFTEAESAGAAHIIIEMDTYGGAVDAADDIGKLFQNVTIPTTVFVNPNAISAGAFIALNADNIVMVPTARMGAATVVDMEGNAGDAKAMSMWIEAMRSAAETNGRDPIYAAAMVDPGIEIEGVVNNETPLTFSANDAVKYGYAEEIVNNRADVLAFLEVENATIVEVSITAAERLARFITNPIVVSILLSLASLGLILELYSPGFGVPGFVGLSSLFLFFFGHMVAGFAGWESLILFIIGLGFIILEVFTPGFGLFGILGIAGVITSLTMASVDITTGLQSIGVAIIISILVMLILGKYLNKRGFWSKLVLQEQLTEGEGKNRFEKKTALVGQVGTTQTKLRPAGVVMINDVRYDVVSEGNLIELNKKVRVIHVEGTRIVVQQINE